MNPESSGLSPALSSALTADLDHLAMQITPQNIVQVSAVLRAESEYLADKVRRAWQDAFVGEPGHDPVSPKAAAGFNRKIENLLTQCDAYHRELRAAADQLAATARAYGHTEEEIAHTLDRVRVGYGEPNAAVLTPEPASPTAAFVDSYRPAVRVYPHLIAGGPPAPTDGSWTPLIPPARAYR